MNLASLKTALCAALIFFSAAAHGHRFHAGITDISMNPRTGNTEIVHSYMSHDVEALLENLYQRQFDLSDEDDIAVFRLYLEKQFQLKNTQGENLKVQWVGLNIDPDNVTVFQEIVKTNLQEINSIKQTTLTDFLADQVNTININHSTATRSRTLQFNRQQSEHTLDQR